LPACLLVWLRPVVLMWVPSVVVAALRCTLADAGCCWWGCARLGALCCAWAWWLLGPCAWCG